MDKKKQVDVGGGLKQEIFDIVLAARTEGIVGGKTKRFAENDADDILQAVLNCLDKVDVENRLYHINWGDGDNAFVLAKSKEEALKDFEPQWMVNYVVELKKTTRMVAQATVNHIKEKLNEGR